MEEDEKVLRRVMAMCPRSTGPGVGCGHWDVIYEDGSDPRWVFFPVNPPKSLKDVEEKCRRSCWYRVRALLENPDASMAQLELRI